jgi:hypothetical protein
MPSSSTAHRESTVSRTSYLVKFREHLDIAENSKKPLQSKLLHAQLAEIYYRLYRDAPMAGR